MIEFVREDTNVLVKITAKYPIANWKYSFSLNVGSAAFALLLHNHFAENFGKLVSEIRQQAYNEGWKDAKAKKRKQIWFSRWLG